MQVGWYYPAIEREHKKKTLIRKARHHQLLVIRHKKTSENRRCTYALDAFKWYVVYVFTRQFGTYAGGNSVGVRWKGPQGLACVLA